MSADNWTFCPECQAKAHKENEEQLKQIQSSYGKVSIEEFDALRRKLPNHLADLEETMREDYEIGIENGKFKISYSASCQECGFKKKFKHSEEIKP